MTKYTLTLLDTTGIQDYIFASNRLQENIGASELVFRATSLWAFNALEEAGLSHNIENPHSYDWAFKLGVTIEDVQAEVIQAAGGNTFILFQDLEQARSFVRCLTLKLLKEAPGLTVLAQHNKEFDLEQDSLPEKRQELLREMQTHKLSRLSSSPILGLAVTAACDSTGLPALRTPTGKQNLGGQDFELLVGDQKKQPAEINRLISRATTFKLAARDLALERLMHEIGVETVTKYGIYFEFPSDIDKLGRISGEESYVAVIHADGNRIGAHFNAVTEKIQAQFVEKGQKVRNREYIRAVQEFSKNLEAGSLAALKETVKTIVSAIEMDEKGKFTVKGKIPIFEDKYGKKYLPFRPLVFGGDDVTFLCNGQIGVELASRYLAAFENHTAALGLEDFHASAGVSIVKMHYPFARAYALSEQLTISAKSLTHPDDCSALDWHFAQSGLSGSLKSIREREYTSGSGHSLVLRPLTLDRGDGSWEKVQAVLDGFNDDYWGRKHNKVIGLRDPLRKGRDAVKQYRLDFDLKELPDIAGPAAREAGWTDSTCWYFDAVELLDHHIPFK